MTLSIADLRVGDLVTFSSADGVKRTGQVRLVQAFHDWAEVVSPCGGALFVERSSPIHRIRRAEDITPVHAGPKTL